MALTAYYFVTNGMADALKKWSSDSWKFSLVKKINWNKKVGEYLWTHRTEVYTLTLLQKVRHILDVYKVWSSHTFGDQDTLIM